MSETSVSPYVWPYVNFLEYADNGAIIQHGSMALGFVEDMQARGGNWIIGGPAPPLNSRVNVVTKTIEPKTECPAVIDGLSLRGLPVPCRVIVGFDQHQIDDGVADFDFDQPGQYDVIVESATHLTGKYRLTKP